MASGLPEVDATATYGAPYTDYAPSEDPSTDLAAASFNLIAMNVAGMTQTACRAWCSFVGSGTTPTDPATNVHGAVWGNSLTVKPSVSRGGTGLYTILWPTTVTDDLGVVHTVNLRRCWVSVEGSTPYLFTTSIASGHIVSVDVFAAGGAANDANGVTITVFAI